ncbi:MAG: carboxypeptidase-like regulatory domain-containing protein [Butyricimonas faecihominis]
MYKEVDGVYVISEKEEVVVQEKKEIVVKGNVKDERGEPMPGATIILKGTTIGITSNETGDFTLLLPAKDSLILLVSFIGYETQEIKVQGDKKLNIRMKIETSALEDVVVTGYANIDKRALPEMLLAWQGITESFQVKCDSKLQVLTFFRIGE